MKVRMKVQVAGSLDGRRWPEPGGVVDLPDRVAAHEVRQGRAEPVAEPEKAEKRPGRKAEKRG